MNTSPLVDAGPTKVVTFPHIKVPHGLSTRVGGYSEGHLASLNAGFTVGDEPARVWKNRALFAAHLGLENLPWLLSMTHGNQVVVVEEKAPVAADQTVRPSTFYSADACVTNKPGVPLSLTVADCVPVFLHDPVKRAVGLAHAGWRGTVTRIVGETAKLMISAFGCRAEDILVGIGPSIGPDAFEVGSEVAEEFVRAFPHHPEIVRAHPDPQAVAAGKSFVDLWRANTVAALEAGVPQSNIVVSGWCTVSHPELFFSHRRDQGKSGRLIAGIVL